MSIGLAAPKMDGEEVDAVLGEAEVAVASGVDRGASASLRRSVGGVGLGPVCERGYVTTWGIRSEKLDQVVLAAR